MLLLFRDSNGLLWSTFYLVDISICVSIVINIYYVECNCDIERLSFAVLLVFCEECHTYYWPKAEYSYVRHLLRLQRDY